MEELFLQHGRPGEPMRSEKVPHKIQERGWKRCRLYGSKIPMRWMVLFNGRWHRVYAKSIGNSVTLFIGKNVSYGIRVTVYPL